MYGGNNRDKFREKTGKSETDTQITNPEISWHMKKSRRTYNGVHLTKKSNVQDVVEQSLTVILGFLLFLFLLG